MSLQLVKNDQGEAHIWEFGKGVTERESGLGIEA